MNPNYPVHIISKGRWESRKTVKALEKIGVPYRIVIEPQELEQYSAVIDPTKNPCFAFQQPRPRFNPRPELGMGTLN